MQDRIFGWLLCLFKLRVISRDDLDVIEAARRDQSKTAEEARSQNPHNDYVSGRIRDLLRHYKVPEEAFIDDHVENAIVQRDEARKRIKELERELAQIKDPLIKHLRLENGEFNMAVGGPIVEHIGAIIVAWFKCGGAQNYVEMSFIEKVEPFDHFTLNVQRVEGKTPHELRDIAEKRAVMLEQALTKAAAAFRWYESIHAAKPDQDKAKRNADYAVMCEEALGSGLMQPQPAGEE
jgi:hypothetical protein